MSYRHGGVFPTWNEGLDERKLLRGSVSPTAECLAEGYAFGVISFQTSKVSSKWNKLRENQWIRWKVSLMIPSLGEEVYSRGESSKFRMMSGQGSNVLPKWSEPSENKKFDMMSGQLCGVSAKPTWLRCKVSTKGASLAKTKWYGHKVFPTNGGLPKIKWAHQSILSLDVTSHQLEGVLPK